MVLEMYPSGWRVRTRNAVGRGFPVREFKSLHLRHVGAKSALLRLIFCKHKPSVRFLAPPFPKKATLAAAVRLQARSQRLRGVINLFFGLQEFGSNTEMLETSFLSPTVRLSLGAYRVPGLAFSFCSSLAFSGGYPFRNSHTRRSKLYIACPDLFF